MGPSNRWACADHVDRVREPVFGRVVSSGESSSRSPTASKGVVPPLGRTKLSVSLRQTRSRVPHTRRTSAAFCALGWWVHGNAQVYPQAIPMVTHSLSRVRTHRPNVKPPACCHPPSPCEWRPTGGFDAPTLGVRTRRRQRCWAAQTRTLWTVLWAGWGRAGVFLWTRRDRAVHAADRGKYVPLATCADGRSALWTGRSRLDLQVASMPVHGVVQVSDTGGTLPAWLH
jgi:hypothetical protein